MNSKYLFWTLIFVSGIILGYSLSILKNITTAIDNSPSSKQSEFAQICSELNGKELNLQNIEKLEGWSFIKDKLTEPDYENIERLNNGTDPFFNVYQKNQYDNTWICAINKNENNTIKAWTYYQYD